MGNFVTNNEVTAILAGGGLTGNNFARLNEIKNTGLADLDRLAKYNFGDFVQREDVVPIPKEIYFIKSFTDRTPLGSTTVNHVRGTTQELFLSFTAPKLLKVINTFTTDFEMKLIEEDSNGYMYQGGVAPYMLVMKHQPSVFIKSIPAMPPILNLIKFYIDETKFFAVRIQNV